MVDRGDFCQAADGAAFYPFDPRPEEIRIEVIATALAKQCRFAGHCKGFYSVAEHSVRASRLVDRAHALAALLHDAAEAYVIDLPRPLKRAPGFAVYRAIEAEVSRAIAKRFGLPVGFEHLAQVQLADDIMLATEKRDLMTPSALAWAPLPAPHPIRIDPWPWRDAEIAFLARFGEVSR